MDGTPLTRQRDCVPCRNKTHDFVLSKIAPRHASMKRAGSGEELTAPTSVGSSAEMANPPLAFETNRATPSVEFREGRPI
jgi:hypothetical protein